jgi:hypothetical protein
MCSVFIAFLLVGWGGVKHTVYTITLVVFWADWTLIHRASLFRLTTDDGLYPRNAFCVFRMNTCSGYLPTKRGKKLEGACANTAKSFRAEYQSLHLRELSKFPTDEGRWSHRRTKWRNHYVFVRLSTGAPSPFSIVCMWFIRTVIYYLKLYTFYCA